MDSMHRHLSSSRRPALRRFLLPLLSAAVLVAARPVAAQQLPNVLRNEAEKQLINRERVGLVTGLPGGVYSRLGTEMSQLVESDGPSPFRVVVQIGRGSVRNLDDLLNLRNVDFALVQSDVVEAYAGQRATYEELRRRMRIVATLHREEIHILSRGPFRNLASLAGRRVNIGSPGSGTNLTARIVFARLGLNVAFDETPTTQARNQLIDGALDAVFYVVGKGADLLRGIPFDSVRRGDLRFIPIPAAQPGLDDYVPARLLHADYPLLVEDGSAVETRAVTALLAVYAWNPGDPRYPAALRFIDRLFSSAPKLVEPGAGFSRDQWCQANLAGTIQRWERFDAADRWLAANRGATTQLRNVPGSNCPSADVPAGCQERFVEELRRDGLVASPPFSPRVQREYDTWRARNAC